MENSRSDQTANNVFIRFDKDMIKYEWNEEFQTWFPSEDQSEFDLHLKKMNDLKVKQQESADLQESNSESKHQESTHSFRKSNSESTHSYRKSNEHENIAKYADPHVKTKKLHKSTEAEESKISSIQKSSVSIEDKQKTNRKNTSIYIKGLPNDVTVDELKDYFDRCGLIMESLYAEGQPRIKVYLDEEGNPKGDALITFLMEESVELAITLFDQSQFRANCPISVEPAVFTGEKSTTKVSTTIEPSIQKHLIKASFDKMKRKLDWSSEEPAASASSPTGGYAEGRVVLLRGMFSKEELDKDSSVAFDIKEDVREECGEKYGKVSNVKIYPALPGGLMTVKFKGAEGAAACIAGLDGRWFDGRRIGACLYDGMLRDEESI